MSVKTINITIDELIELVKKEYPVMITYYIP